MPTDTLVYNSSVLTATITVSSMVTLTTGASNVWQGNYVDFGATRAEIWLARMAAQFTAAPTAGGTVELYMAWASATATSGNFPGGCSGVDGGWAGPDAAPANNLKQLTFLGALVACSAASTVLQIQNVSMFQARQRYGVPVLALRTSQTLASNNFSLTFHDIRPQSQ